MKTNENGFVSVMIQYRLGAFGFLSSEDVHKYGKTNAGVLDMRFALEWVQKHVSKFGGDPSRVTIGGVLRRRGCDAAGYGVWREGGWIVQ
jgi:carboxylesterase type B